MLIKLQHIGSFHLVIGVHSKCLDDISQKSGPVFSNFHVTRYKNNHRLIYANSFALLSSKLETEQEIIALCLETVKALGVSGTPKQLSNVCL